MTSVCDHAALHARLHPDRLAVHELASDRRWTYAQLDSAIARLALHLSHEAEGRTGERIAALSKNRAELVLLHLACARAGLIFVPLNWRLATAELKALLQDCTPLRLYGDEQLAAHDLSGSRLAAS
jgi:fatty-acyl-CoA synthase